MRMKEEKTMEKGLENQVYFQDQMILKVEMLTMKIMSKDQEIIKFKVSQFTK